MELDHCVFPDDLLYDLENNTWLRVDSNGEATVGVTSLLSAIAGRLIWAKLKPVGVTVERNQSLGTLESERFVGPIPCPLSGVLVETNLKIVERPRTVNDSPYDDGWIARVRPFHFAKEESVLSKAADSKVALAQKIAKFHARCFKAFPDHEMFEIGTECSAVIVRLNELIASIPLEEVVHLVSDDPTAYVEMERWSDETGQSLVDWRKEDNLFHFIVRKIR